MESIMITKTREDEIQQEKRHRNVIEGKLTHSEYYAWLCDFIGLNDKVLSDELKSWIMKSKKEFFNNIPLHIWDGYDYIVKFYARKSGLTSWLLCETVCCLKELARQWKEQQMPNKIG
jgi:hypothetical protein